MEARPIPLQPIRFGRFELHPVERRLLHDGEPVEVGARAFDVLVVLTAHAGHLVSKSQLLDEAWPGLVVEEGNIAVQIMALRKAIGAEVIATVPGHGYRFAQPVQLIAPSRSPLPSAPPTASHNLPATTTSFIGREDELGQLDALLGGHRFVSLLGPGGIGKTRLALEAAARQRTRFADGVWWVELAPVFDPTLVVAEVATLWGLRAGDGSSIEGVLLRHLAQRRLLLVVDNCEHLREAAAALVRRVLRAAPDVTVLGTSRESLGVPGEVELRLGALPLPDATASSVEESASVRLFLDRMHAVRPDLAAGPETLEAVSRVCRRLEGMPLGLELAAARLRTLTPAELAERLENSFRVLGTASKDAPPHQRSLDAALDWSHGLLSEIEQVLFRRLAVFAGGFDVEAAEAVCAGGTVDADAIVEHLDSLVDKSLVLPLHGAGARSRFHLLEPARQYALQRLRAAGEETERLAAHARHYSAFVSEVAPGLRGPAQVQARERIERDLGNIRLALRTLLEGGEVERHLALAFDLFLFWWHAALHVEGLAVLLDGLGRSGDDTAPTVRIRAWFAAALLAVQLSDPRSIEHARAGLEVATRAGTPSDQARLQLVLAATLNCTGDDAAAFRRALEAGERGFEDDSAPSWWEANWERAFMHLTVLGAEWAGNPRLAEHYERALSGFEQAGDVVMTALTLAYSALLRGQLDGARIVENLQRTVAMLAVHRSPHTEGHAELLLGRLLAERGDAQEGGRYLGSAMRKLLDLGDLNCWSGACRSLAAIQIDGGEALMACEHLEAALGALPQVLIPTSAAARTLELAAAALLARGKENEAAFTLGIDARGIRFQVRPGRPAHVARDPGRSVRHRQVLDALQQRLGTERLQRHMDDASAIPADAALQRVALWLRP